MEANAEDLRKRGRELEHPCSVQKPSRTCADEDRNVGRGVYETLTPGDAGRGGTQPPTSCRGRILYGLDSVVQVINNLTHSAAELFQEMLHCIQKLVHSRDEAFMWANSCSSMHGATRRKRKS